MIYKAVEKVFRNAVYNRADDNGCVFYFSKNDFEGLNRESFPFESSLGHKMQGYFYHYDNFSENRLIIFEHGMGSGHTGYMKEIEKLAKAGYLVFSYDHTGCMESGGETTNGFAQSLRDLDDAVKAIKKDDRFSGLPISVMGHSWGGFSTMNISALHPDIEKVVALSGFVAVENILKGFFSGPLSLFYKRIYEGEKKSNPEYVKYSAVDSLKNTKSKVLIIHSDDDKTVSCKNNFALLEKELSGKENITLIKVTGKNHNPNYTVDALKYKDEFFRVYQKALRKKQLNTKEEKDAFKKRFDWERMIKQDEEIWKVILDFLAD